MNLEGAVPWNSAVPIHSEREALSLAKVFSKVAIRTWMCAALWMVPAMWAQPATRPQQAPPPPPGADRPVASSPVGAMVDPNSYEIGAEDIILIRVWRDADFTGQHFVRPDGKITLPLIGEVVAAGKTPEKLGLEVQELLTKYLTKPEVTVQVQQVNSKKYWVTGGVNKSGMFPLIRPTRVLEALGDAGGLKEFAKKNKIIILRKGQQIKFNYSEVVKGKKLEQNIFLENGDYIIVPE
jgi:polysaccharide export outer membrane protein